MSNYTQQLKNEYKYSRKTLNKEVTAYLLSGDVDPELLRRMDSYLSGLYNYFSDDLIDSYYESKKVRVTELVVAIAKEELSVKGIALDVLVMTLGIAKEEQINRTAHALALNLMGKVVDTEHDLVAWIKTASEILYYAADADIINMFQHDENYNYADHNDEEEDAYYQDEEDFEEPKEFGMWIEADMECPEAIKDYINDYRYMTPMLVEPDFIEDNYNSGLLSNEPDSLILKAHNIPNKPIHLDLINWANQVVMAIDLEAIKLVHKTRDDFKDPKDYRQYKEYTKTSEAVHEEIIAAGNQFWLRHKFDSRGRLYCQGYHCNYMGSDYAKSTLELKHKDKVELPKYIGIKKVGQYYNCIVQGKKIGRSIDPEVARSIRNSYITDNKLTKCKLS